MNKLIFLFTALIFISCESEDSADDSNNSSNSDSSVLVKTITTTTNDGDYSNVITEEYFYEGNKIERKLEYRSGSDYSNSNDVYRTYDYTYANNKISNVKRYDLDNNLNYECIFNYNSNGNLVYVSEEWFYGSNYEEKSTYSFDYDGNYILNCMTDTYDSEVYNSYIKYTANSNSDITFAESIQSCSFSAPRSTGNEDSSQNIEYDTNPYPFKNVTGNNFIISNLADIFTYADLFGHYNNITKIIWLDIDGQYSSETTYDYNSDNYPRNVQIYDEDGDIYETVNIEYY